jgi:hypothetical protein
MGDFYKEKSSLRGNELLLLWNTGGMETVD